MPRIGSAVPVQRRIGDGERVERGLVAGAVEGGTQHGRDGNPSDHLDLLVAQVKPTTVHSDRGGLGVRRIDGSGYSRRRVPEGGQRRCGQTRVAGDGEVDVRLPCPHRQIMNQGCRCVRQAGGGGQELLGGNRTR